MRSLTIAIIDTALKTTTTSLNGSLKMKRNTASSKNPSPRNSFKEKKIESWPSMPEFLRRSWRQESERK